jgi:hypothetical protein
MIHGEIDNIRKVEAWPIKPSDEVIQILLAIDVNPDANCGPPEHGTKHRASFSCCGPSPMGPMKKSLCPSLLETHSATLEEFRERQADRRLREY